MYDTIAERQDKLTLCNGMQALVVCILSFILIIYNMKHAQPFKKNDYFILPKAIFKSMSRSWRAEFNALIWEIEKKSKNDGTYNLLPRLRDYSVTKIGKAGKFIKDPFNKYHKTNKPIGKVQHNRLSIHHWIIAMVVLLFIAVVLQITAWKGQSLCEETKEVVFSYDNWVKCLDPLELKPQWKPY